MKIYTKKGDSGKTLLLGGRRVPKSDPRVRAFGELDELSAALGLAESLADPNFLEEEFLFVQNLLHRVSTQLAATGNYDGRAAVITDSDIVTLELKIDAVDEELEPLQSFIAYGGHPSSAHLQLARAVCRRAERSIVALSEVEEVDEAVLRFINRLSDYLFLLGRLVNCRAGIKEKYLQGHC